MSESNGCDSNGQNETEGTGGQRGKGQARSKAGRSKKKNKKQKKLRKVVCGCFSEFIHLEVSSEGVMICIYSEVTGAMAKRLSSSPAVALRGRDSERKHTARRMELRPGRAGEPRGRCSV